MRMNNLERRIKALEKRGSGSDVALTMPGGSVRVIRVADPLGILLSAFRRAYAAGEGEAMPASRLDSMLNLLRQAGATGSETSPLIETAHCVLHDIERISINQEGDNAS